LIQEHVGNLRAAAGADLSRSGFWIPLIRQNIHTKIVFISRVSALDDLQRGAPDRHLAVWKLENQPRWTAPPVVTGHRDAFDRCREGSPQHEVDAQREGVELKNKMFAPSEDFNDSLSAESFDSYRAVAAYPANTSPNERLELLSGKVNGRSFHLLFLARTAAGE